jgi:hypothetical protein
VVLSLPAKHAVRSALLGKPVATCPAALGQQLSDPRTCADFLPSEADTLLACDLFETVMFGGLDLINAVPHRSVVAVAWVTVVVGVHFFGLGRRTPLYYGSHTSQRQSPPHNRRRSRRYRPLVYGYPALLLTRGCKLFGVS